MRGSTSTRITGAVLPSWKWSSSPAVPLLAATPTMSGADVVDEGNRSEGPAPAYCVATGKVLLAFQSDDYLDRRVSELKKFTSLRITDHAALQAELRTLRPRRKVPASWDAFHANGQPHHP
jgi:Bacterial transcriptional regulator